MDDSNDDVVDVEGVPTITVVLCDLLNNPKLDHLRCGRPLVDDDLSFVIFANTHGRSIGVGVGDQKMQWGDCGL